MKIIISRKGFDSGSGGTPSPILPDERMVSFPIPDIRSPYTYGDITVAGKPLAQLVSDLTGGELGATDGAHLDPDLDPESLTRSPEWRPLFGQVGAALGHLLNHEIAPGDLFLFFGLFRRVECVDGKYRWCRDSAPVHAFWGWLQIEAIFSVSGSLFENQPEWIRYHPHFHGMGRDKNCIFLAKETLELPGNPGGSLPGAGRFRYFKPSLQLTAEPPDRLSRWRVPAWLMPLKGKRPLSYHHKRDRWQKSGGDLFLNSVTRGQEFILQAEDYLEALPWAEHLIQQHC